MNVYDLIERSEKQSILSISMKTINREGSNLSIINPLKEKETNYLSIYPIQSKAE